MPVQHNSANTMVPGQQCSTTVSVEHNSANTIVPGQQCNTKVPVQQCQYNSVSTTVLVQQCQYNWASTMVPMFWENSEANIWKKLKAIFPHYSFSLHLPLSSQFSLSLFLLLRHPWPKFSLPSFYNFDSLTEWDVWVILKLSRPIILYTLIMLRAFFHP